MRLTIAVAVCLVLSFPAVFAQEPALATQHQDTQQEFIARSRALMKAVESQDRAALERLVANDFTLETPGDPREPVRRATWIDNAVGMKWENFEFHHFRVRILDDVAVVTFLLDFKVTTRAGLPISSNAQIVDVWVRRNGQWQIAARHLGASSIEGKIRLVAGFLAGLALWLLIAMIRRMRRRAAAGQ